MLTLALAALVLWQISSPIPYDYNITAQRRNNVRSNNTFMLQPQELLYSGDKFQIEITPAKDLLFYAFLYSSSGSAQILFPSPDVSMDNHLKTRALITQFHQQGFGPWMNRPARKQSFSFLLANHLKSSTVFLWN